MPMSTPQSSGASSDEAAAAGEEIEIQVREIHALAPPPSLEHRTSWDVVAGGVRSPAGRSITGSETVSSEGFTTMSREFNAMVLAGSNLPGGGGNGDGGVGGGIGVSNLVRIGEEYMEVEENNPLAIVPDMNPVSSPWQPPVGGVPAAAEVEGQVSLDRVIKEEVESKIAAWQASKVAKINNRFKRDDVIINGWESAQLEKATTSLKKIERKLDEERAKAVEKSQNDIAKVRRKAKERRAEAEAKRGAKVAKIFELANMMRALGRAPSRRSFF